MTVPADSQRADLEKAVRSCGGLWDTERGRRALRDAGHDPQDKHTRRILRDLANEGLLVKAEDRPVTYRLAQPDEEKAGSPFTGHRRKGGANQGHVRLPRVPILSSAPARCGLRERPVALHTRQLDEPLLLRAPRVRKAQAAQVVHGDDHGVELLRHAEHRLRRGRRNGDDQPFLDGPFQQLLLVVLDEVHKVRADHGHHMVLCVATSDFVQGRAKKRGAALGACGDEVQPPNGTVMSSMAWSAGSTKYTPRATVVVVDRVGLLPLRVGVVLDTALPDLRVRRVELLLGDQEGVVLGGVMLSAGIVAKSSVTPLLRPTAMNGPHSAVISRPSSFAKNSADSRLSRAWTIVWFNSADKECLRRHVPTPPCLTQPVTDARCRRPSWSCRPDRSGGRHGAAGARHRYLLPMGGAPHYGAANT